MENLKQGKFIIEKNNVGYYQNLFRKILDLVFGFIGSLVFFYFMQSYFNMNYIKTPFVLFLLIELFLIIFSFKFKRKYIGMGIILSMLYPLYIIKDIILSEMSSGCCIPPGIN